MMSGDDTVSYSAEIRNNDSLVIDLLIDKYATEYQITVLEGAISNSGILNSEGLNVVFFTEEAEEEPEPGNQQSL